MEVSFEKKKSHLHMVISYSLFLLKNTLILFNESALENQM